MSHGNHEGALSGLFRMAWLVFRKDLRLEFRSRYSLNAILMFAITALVAIGFSIGPTSMTPLVLAPLLWILLFFSAMSGLAHIFIREEEQQTADTLRTSVTPLAVWLGKWLFNAMLLFGLEIVIVPLFLVLLDASIANVAIFFPVLLAGSLGLASASTIIAAIVARAGSRGALFAILSFPIVLPILLTAINSTRMAMVGMEFSDCVPDLKVLVSFTLCIVVASVLVFEYVWRN